jgi:hypothetical protein
VTANPEKPGTLLDGQLDRAIDPEYAAISTMAVVALGTSIAGAAAFLGAPLVAVPLLGLVIGLAALRKIRRSQGVLAGRGVALAAVLVGGAVAAGAAAYHVQAYLRTQAMLQSLETRAYAVVDDLAAGQYQKVYEMMPEQFRRRQGAGVDAFRGRMEPSFKGAGPLVRRTLLSLQVIQSEDGTVVAPALMRMEFERRYLDMSVYFLEAAPGRWDIVGVAAEETFDSQAKFGPTKQAAPPKEAVQPKEAAPPPKESAPTKAQGPP